MIRAQKPILISICVVLPLFAKAGEATVDDVLTKMDQAASSFKGMASNIDQMKYTAVISDKSTENGSFLLKKNGAEPHGPYRFQKARPQDDSLLRQNG